MPSNPVITSVVPYSWTSGTGRGTPSLQINFTGSGGPYTLFRSGIRTYTGITTSPVILPDSGTFTDFGYCGIANLSESFYIGETVGGEFLVSETVNQKYLSDYYSVNASGIGSFWTFTVTFNSSTIPAIPDETSIKTLSNWKGVFRYMASPSLTPTLIQKVSNYKYNVTFTTSGDLPFVLQGQFNLADGLPFCVSAAFMGYLPTADTVVSTQPQDAALLVTVTPGDAACYDYSVDSEATFRTIRGTYANPTQKKFAAGFLSNLVPYTGVIRDRLVVLSNNTLSEPYSFGTHVGLWGSSTFSGTPGPPPVAPVIDAVTSGNLKLTVAFTAPPPPFYPILRYEYSLNAGATFVDAGLPSGSFDITGLIAGVSYPVTLRAVNIIDNGAWSNSVSGTPATIPSAPTITSVLPAGDGTLSVAYTAPSSDGGAAITAYEYSLDGGSNAFYADFPLNPFFITGLSNGTTYSIVIRAINSIGDGAWSAPVQGTPLAVPSEPLIDIVTAENNALSVAYTAPVSDGGSPITSYQYSFDGGTNVVSVGLTNPLPISGLTNGQLYTIILRAVNALGAGPWSAPAYAMPTSGQKVFALGDRFIRVAFDSTKPAPVHVSSTGEKDILNPRSWNVLQLYSDRSGGRVLTGLSVKQLDNWTYELLMLQPFLREGSEYKDFTYGAVHVSGTGQVSLDIAFEDSSVAVINQNCSISIASVNANNTAQAVSRGYALKDIANVSISPLVSELGGSYYEFLGGTLLINSAGDYAGMDGEALLRKLIMRRLISRKGDFFHLPDYGANLAVKGVFSTANLPSLAKDIERQVEQEPDVEKAKVTLTYQAATSILVVQVQARMRSTGQQTGLSMSLPLSGTKSF